MTFRQLFAPLAAAGLVAIAMAAPAAATPINSTAGGATCELNSNLFADTSCSLQAITPHNAWQPNNPGGTDAVWVSYADSGIGGDTLAPTSQSDWVMKITETFTIGAGGGNILMQIWADDTAGVYLNGDLMAAPQFGQNVCADKPIGCEPDEFYALNEALGAGEHTLELYAYQVGTGKTVNSNPFGIIYAGDISGVVPNEIPAPTALGLLGLAGFGLVAARRRRERA